MGLKVGGSSVQSTEQSRLQMNQDKRRGVRESLGTCKAAQRH